MRYLATDCSCQPLRARKAQAEGDEETLTCLNGMQDIRP